MIAPAVPSGFCFAMALRVQLPIGEEVEAHGVGLIRESALRVRSQDELFAIVRSRVVVRADGLTRETILRLLLAHPEVQSFALLRATPRVSAPLAKAGPAIGERNSERAKPLRRD
jgi:hypothetical protein